jgi:hypothetical protein
VNDVIDAEYTATSALAVTSEAAHQSPALFGTDDPVAVIEKAVRVADALKAVIVSKKLVSQIQGKEYVQVEAWLTLAAMLRLTTVCEWSRRVENGWEARVFVRDANGNTVGAAEAQCLATERTKKSWEDYALRSMAQTRATSKSLRSVLGFIVVLAGYSATPAEEMPDDPKEIARETKRETPADAKKQVVERARALGVIPAHGGIDELRAYCVDNSIAATPGACNAHFDALAKPTPVAEPAAAPKGDPPASPAQRAMLMALHGKLKHPDDVRHELYMQRFGKPSSKELTRSEASAIIDELNRALDAQGVE